MSHPSPRCAVVIAVKSRGRGKSHLAGCLADAQRIALIRAMLKQVLEASCAARSVEATWVVSPERDTVPSAIPVLRDEGMGMNEAFALARERLREAGMQTIVALPADLPQISAADLDELVLAAGRGVAIAPDLGGSGTNALVSPLELPLRFCFGPDSRRLHTEEARRLGVEPVIVLRPGISFDVDLPEDLVQLRRLPDGMVGSGPVSLPAGDRS